MEWRLEIPSQDLDLHIQPLIDDQEMRLSVRYWEGAVTVTNADSDQALGQGYLEMTGYESGAHTSP